MGCGSDRGEEVRGKPAVKTALVVCNGQAEYEYVY